MDLLVPLRRFDRFQQRHAALGVPVAVLKKFSDDGAGGLAALCAYYAFFSIIPLLLVFVTILAFVFHGNESVQKTITDSTVAHFPVIGSDLKTKDLTGNITSLVIGVAVLLWAGLGVTQAAHNAFDKIWAVPYKNRPDFFMSRVRGLGLVATLGVLLVISSLASGIVTGGLGGTAVKVGGLISSFALNLGVLAAAFRFMTAAAVPTRSLWIGVVVGALMWTGLESLGGVYVSHVIKNATNTYGFFALSIGLLAYLHLGARMTMYAAEINVVLVRELWPRSLFAPTLPSDERALAALAKVEERTQNQTIEVHFDDAPVATPIPEPPPVRTGGQEPPS
jgi:membrane protein